MNDDMLSQEEINALLNGMGDEEENESSKMVVVEDYLSGIEQDAVGEIGNISFGSSATALSTLLDQKVEITTPLVSIVKQAELDKEFPKPHVAVGVKYISGFEGMNVLAINTKDASIIADLMLGNDGTSASEELGEMEISAVQEAMNQMMGSASTSMSTIFGRRVDISPPEIEVLHLPEEPNKIELPDDDVLIMISFNLKIGNLIDSKIMQLLTVDFAKEMVELLMNPAAPVQEREEKIYDEVSAATEGESDSTPYQTQHQRNEAEPVRGREIPAGGQHRQQAQQESRNNSYDENNQEKQKPKRAANIQAAAFSDFGQPVPGETGTKNLDMLLDIPLEVTVELGRTKKSVKDILEMTQGSIIELDKLAGEPVDILVNQRLVAQGEVVVIDENFGVRVTDIVSQKERITKLR
ncbi:flagellar motor switch phosphatase FliY [Evansella sp. LMS18]|uniref:flagellar motor switch phosphatase FliY n=1 Tax=Evansella sp. LMS18 TaxID=2924033 RepID=UPI0020D06528|nr:flagellar motor switch phosphatase FliY [Evansella sp. LMS18]UTR10857.1 flagellar motor switch phosphatase FliY [Evansella sp. LMS18]